MPSRRGAARPGASRGAWGAMLRCLATGLLVLWSAAGRARGQTATGHESVQTPPAVATVPNCYWLQLRAPDGLRHFELLHELRGAVLAGDRTGITAAVDRLERRANDTRALLRERLDQLGAQVRYWFWIVDAVSIEVPAEVGAEALASLPQVTRVLPVEGFTPHLRNATGDRFANVDAVQQDPRYTAAGWSWR